MHTSVSAWVSRVLTRADIAGRTVLEVGSRDVNGSVRAMVEALGPATYVGTDMQSGPGVDQVVRAEDLPATFDENAFDVVVSTEMLEHAAAWRDCLMAMALVLRPGGLLVLTTRSPGFPRHDYPGDFWRFSREVVAAALIAAGCGAFELVGDPQPGHPGVFVRARKSDPWRPDWPRLAAVEVEPAP
jgi:SAM-dependent methyltransferase